MHLDQSFISDSLYLTAILPKRNFVFNLLKSTNNLSLLNPFVLDYMIDLCCLN